MSSLTYKPEGHQYNSPTWVSNFVQKLAALCSLESFSIKIRVDPQAEFSLEPLHGLRVVFIDWVSTERPSSSMISQIARLVTRCPDLESFGFSMVWLLGQDLKTWAPVTLEDFFRNITALKTPLRLKEIRTRATVVTPEQFARFMPHLRTLTTLEIELSLSPTSYSYVGEICGILQQAEIHLKSISIDTIHHPAIFTYLSSYSGAERIVLQPRHPLDDSPKLVHDFFTTVLPRHRGSLKILELGTYKITAWSNGLRPDHLLELQECKRLENLCCWIYVSPEEYRRKDARVLVSFS
jgi:hypothetical protein